MILQGMPPCFVPYLGQVRGAVGNVLPTIFLKIHGFLKPLCSSFARTANK
jgi:hypothetical protein